MLLHWKKKTIFSERLDDLLQRAWVTLNSSSKSNTWRLRSYILWSLFLFDEQFEAAAPLKSEKRACNGFIWYTRYRVYTGNEATWSFSNKQRGKLRKSAGQCYISEVSRRLSISGNKTTSNFFPTDKTKICKSMYFLKSIRHFLQKNVKSGDKMKH